MTNESKAAGGDRRRGQDVDTRPGGSSSRLLHSTMKLSNRQPIDDVLAATDFPGLVEQTVGSLPRRPSNRPVMALCPWHEEKTPSLAVYPNHAHCFGCSWHGDALDWLQKRDGIGFPEALRELAHRAGISVEPLSPEVARVVRTRREYEAGLTLAAEHFAGQLWKSERALSCARARAWTDEAITAEQIGFAGGGTLPDLGNRRAQRVAGALNRWAGQVGGAIVYAHRRAGHIVYLAGRSIAGKAHYNPPTDLAGPRQAYLNALYAGSVDRLAVVEGQADAVTLGVWGVPAVALASSGLTGKLPSLLRRHFERGVAIYAVPDGDGKTDIAGLVEATGPLLNVVVLPAGAGDVNEFGQQGAAAEDFQALLDEAPTWLAMEIERIAGLKGKERGEALRGLFIVLAGLDDFMLAEYRGLVRERLGIKDTQISRYLKAARGELAEERRNGHDARYVEENGRLCTVRFDGDGNRIVEPLCNFVAEITEDVARDNGEDILRQFAIAGRLANGRPLPQARVEAGKFSRMDWMGDTWGVQAVVRAGWAARDRLREAIQLQSLNAEIRYVFTHTGWREIDGRRVYLHAGGAVGLDGAPVELDRELENYRLPAESRDTADAVRASLRFLDIAPLAVTVPLWAAAYLAPLAEIIYPGFTLWVYGVTGAMKSTVAALVLSHYGRFTDKDLLDWSSTANRLEKVCFLAKDTLLVIDDFAPASDPWKAREMERNAARIVRNVGNRSGRGRLAADLSLRTTYRPRGLVLSTGEQVPDGQSVSARLFTVEVSPGDVDLEKLTAAQAEAGRYPHALAGYLQWIVGQWDHLVESLPRARREQRSRLLQEMRDSHLRIPDALATLYLGFDLGLAFAARVGALGEAEAQEWRERGWEALKDCAEEQSQRVERERPTVKFLAVLGELLAQGRVRLEERDGTAHIGGDAAAAELLGWYGGDYFYLLPAAAYNRVARFLRDEGGHFPVKERTLRRHLADEGYLARSAGRYTDVLRLGAKTQRVLTLNRSKVESIISVESGVDF